MAQSTPLVVGLDVHKDSVAVAHAQGLSADPPVVVGAIRLRGTGLARRHRFRQCRGDFALCRRALGRFPDCGLGSLGRLASGHGGLLYLVIVSPCLSTARSPRSTPVRASKSLTFEGKSSARAEHRAPHPRSSISTECYASDEKVCRPNSCGSPAVRQRAKYALS